MNKTGRNRLGNKHNPRSPEWESASYPASASPQSIECSQLKALQSQWGLLVKLGNQLRKIQLKELQLIEIHMQYIFLCARHLKWMKYLCGNDFAFLMVFFWLTFSKDWNLNDLNWFNRISFKKKRIFVATVKTHFVDSAFTAFWDTLQFLCISL